MSVQENQSCTKEPSGSHEGARVFSLGSFFFPLFGRQHRYVSHLKYPSGLAAHAEPSGVNEPLFPAAIPATIKKCFGFIFFSTPRLALGSSQRKAEAPSPRQSSTNKYIAYKPLQLKAFCSISALSRAKPSSLSVPFTQLSSGFFILKLHSGEIGTCNELASN